MVLPKLSGTLRSGGMEVIYCSGKNKIKNIKDIS
jgi:hypothetical protein